jgi:hypothetical protein
LQVRTLQLFAPLLVSVTYQPFFTRIWLTN